jgi:putative ATPase
MGLVPLAEKIRPKSIDQVYGQDHIVGKNGIVSDLLTNGRPFSVIFWGPPGSGKTTLARIIANRANVEFVELSAVSAAKKDIMKVIDDAKINQRLGQQTVLFVDEIHRFNKSQQDAFLPYVENGIISFIGATTENPSFEVISPLLSRSKVIVLEPIDEKNMVKILKRASSSISNKSITPQNLKLISKLSSGDARMALSTLEIASNISKGKQIEQSDIERASQTRLPSYDKHGDKHFDTISAFIKSMRGSDANATLYYLARMLRAGEDPKLIARRMIIFASEDIGIAASPALNLAVSTFQAVERIGMPECQYNLFHCAIVLAKAKKSRAVTDAMNKALDITNEYPNLKIPLTLRNAPTKLMKDLGYNKDYKWQAEYYPKGGFLPEEISGLNLFD